MRGDSLATGGQLAPRRRGGVGVPTTPGEAIVVVLSTAPGLVVQVGTGAGIVVVVQ